MAELDEFEGLFGAARGKCHWEMAIIRSAKLAERSDGFSNLRQIL
jgi:hypothetical protein